MHTASMETAPLPSHLYTRGLLNGRHSDITVHAFGTKYALHRLILDRAPFFSSALSEPWFESTSKDITLQPDDVDSNITQAAFELALKKLYGCDISAEEDGEAIGLFATGCWLEMTDLIDTSVNSILRQMKPSKLGSFIRLVTSNYYGKPGDRILASAKSMLCREGWEMSIRHWDDISGDIIREIIGGDGFFVQGEWERFVLAKRLLDRRLRFKALESGLYDSTGKIKRPPPSTTAFDAIRFDTVYRKSMPVVTPQVPEAFDPWLALYTSPDVSALLVLLDEGIHYVHLSFEQLKKIREQRDALGLPLMPERVISNALWMSMELRQKVVNANELDLELGLTEEANEHDEDHPISPTPNRKLTAENEGTSKGKGKQIEVPVEQEEEEMESGSWDGNALPRKFWIPTTDSTSVMGGTPESIMAAAHASHPSIPRHISRLSASLDPQDVQWATDFTAAGERPQTPGHVKVPTITPPLCYSWYPPFRFAAEFPNPRSLKEKKRVYSRTVWYAGSLWNVYIQKVETTKNTQLGVYLHRAKDKEHDGLRHGAVDERIGQVELLMRRNQRHQREHQQQHQQGDADDETGTSSGDPDATLIHHSADATRANAISSLLRGDPIHKSSQNPLPLSSMPDRTYNSSILSDSDDPSSLLDYSSTTAAPSTSPNSKEKMAPRRKPALPAYVDGRPTIKTYFKIYSPSKGGRMLSVYESAPDRFNFSQSWGWKSSTMILDDGMLGYEAAGEPKKTGNLRFMVVIGKCIPCSCSSLAHNACCMALTDLIHQATCEYCDV